MFRATGSNSSSDFWWSIFWTLILPKYQVSVPKINHPPSIQRIWKSNIKKKLSDKINSKLKSDVKCWYHHSTPQNPPQRKFKYLKFSIMIFTLKILCC